MNKEAYKQQRISEKLPFYNIHFDNEKELAKFYISIFQKCVESISNKQLTLLEEFPKLDQIQDNCCYVMKLQSNDLMRIARKVKFLSFSKKYFNADNFKYAVCNLNQQPMNLQCRIVKVNDQINLSDDYENLRDYKFVHFYQKNDRINQNQIIQSTIKYQDNKLQQQKSEEVQDRPTSLKSCTNQSQVEELHGSVIQEKALENKINKNLKKENSSNLIDEDSDSKHSNEAATTNNQNQITINNKNANEIKINYQLQQQHGLPNQSQKEDLLEQIKNLHSELNQLKIQLNLKDTQLGQKDKVSNLKELQIIEYIKLKSLINGYQQ
ncbi:hypothetical protein TTHERM_00913360 (macronuclear) [Tetrahymena thermophila SB210]|uniref:Uncharacterized protein n=1 Tax=Tetrahymena thermophila (strain SB210) TaxID=312017 RepID=Q23TT8_TETTS|nr:hypothetical protein TTHERM_00913360 [Tetrahymena thermophila SB210]EAR99957.2 hypothetical protein TTHERM_00913360 [Tetrahymena thermophila SB210]|eukprot:XP_001020202.2 hypothetical protein TTHERM_00913360 [Tetrahymena thermophila SB210]